MRLFRLNKPTILKVWQTRKSKWVAYLPMTCYFLQPPINFDDSDDNQWYSNEIKVLHSHSQSVWFLSHIASDLDLIRLTLLHRPGVDCRLLGVYKIGTRSCLFWYVIYLYCNDKCLIYLLVMWRWLVFIFLIYKFQFYFFISLSGMGLYF